MTYILQAAGLVGASYFVLLSRRKLSFLIIAIPLVWFIGVSVIYWRYGPIGQWAFYQNDQYFHWRVVNQLLVNEFNMTFDRLNFLRVPYTAPAFLLSVVGIDSTLALKYVSLICAMSSASMVEGVVRKANGRFLIRHIWITALPITVFFSLLALRETMMLMCVTHLFLGKSHPRRALSLLVLVILRPHLAAAIVFGLCWGWLFSRFQERWYLGSVLITAVLPIYLGTIGFSIGNYIIYQLPLQLYQELFLQNQVIQIFSAFAGLQFLTVDVQTVEYTTRSLLFIRVLFPEIILAPLVFSVSCFFLSPRTTRLKISVLATFVFFMAVSSGTEYLSVRQSLPLMPIMGVAALLSFSQIFQNDRTALTNSEITPLSTPPKEFVERS